MMNDIFVAILNAVTILLALIVLPISAFITLLTFIVSTIEAVWFGICWRVTDLVYGCYDYQSKEIENDWNCSEKYLINYRKSLFKKIAGY